MKNNYVDNYLIETRFASLIIFSLLALSLLITDKLFPIVDLFVAFLFFIKMKLNSLSFKREEYSEKIIFSQAIVIFIIVWVLFYFLSGSGKLTYYANFMVSIIFSWSLYGFYLKRNNKK